ncbi:MAG: DUF4124 domain-containing protein [Betaproteobacteria bacterium]|nr:DUF4124 domain-containing protein [Betaproteobacteria bacterium]
MHRLTALVLGAVAGVSFAAEAYRWVDEKGVTNYGEKPPANRPATQVNTNPGGIVETGGQYSQKPGTEQQRRAEERPPAVAPAPAAVGPVRGMDFDTFIRLQHGMTEGELLIRAGKPDHESIENLRHDIVKTFYYFPTVGNPFTTVVTLRGGRIFNIDRVKKF